MITEEFKKRFTEYVKGFEDEKLKIYDDGFGNPTIGVGFILINKIGKKWQAYELKDLQKLGINLTTKQYEIIENYAEAKSKRKDTSNLKDQLKKLDFTIAPEISQKLLMYSIEDKYNIIKNTIGEEHWDKINLARQIGVMDHAFHWGNVVELKESLIAGNYNETAEKMREIKPVFKARAEFRADLVEHGKMDFEGIYIAQSGDNLTKIARLHCLKLDELKKLNPELSKLKTLPIGQKINIPPTVKTIPLIDIDDEGNKLFKFEIVHNKCKISEDNIAGETKEILLSVGPFFVRLKANNQVTNIGQYSKDSNIFLNKTSLNTPTENSIIDLFKSTQGVTEGPIHTKTLNLTKEQYNKILQYIESGIKYGDTKVLQSQTSTNETSNNVEQHYIVKADDSASLVQNLYHATGLPLYFTAAYSKPELVNLESVDAKKALEAYSSRDDIIKKLNSIYGDSKEEIAKMLNLDPEQVSRASKLKGCVPTCRAVEGTKFSVKIDQEMLDSITSIIDVSDNKSIKHEDLVQGLQNVFLSNKIPPELPKDQLSHLDQNTNFSTLKSQISNILSHSKSIFDKLLGKVDQQAAESNNSGHSIYTQDQVTKLFMEKYEALQKEFNNAHNKTSSGLLICNNTVTPKAQKIFQEKELALSTWISDELAKIPGTPQYLQTHQSSDKTPAVSSKTHHDKIVTSWNKEIDTARTKDFFNDKIDKSLNNPNKAIADLDKEFDIFLQGASSELHVDLESL